MAALPLRQHGDKDPGPGSHPAAPAHSICLELQQPQRRSPGLCRTLVPMTSQQGTVGCCVLGRDASVLPLMCGCQLVRAAGIVDCVHISPGTGGREGALRAGMHCSAVGSSANPNRREIWDPMENQALPGITWGIFSFFLGCKSTFSGTRDWRSAPCPPCALPRITGTNSPKISHRAPQNPGCWAGLAMALPALNSFWCSSHQSPKIEPNTFGTQ